MGEQSGIRAGDGGFDVKVKGKTVLKGGAITSTQVAVDEQRNDFESEGGVELEDVRNEARYKASGWSAGAGVYVSDKKNQDGSTVMDTDGQPVKEVNRTRGLGWGDDKGDASSTTRAGISGIAGDKNARTGDAETGLAPIFDRERVNDEVNAQVTIRRNGLPVLAKGWGDQADAQRDKLRKEAAKLDASDPARAQLLAEADRWDEGGVYRATGHAVIGGLAGGTQGALGAGSASLAAPALNDLQHQMQTALQDAGMNTLLAQEAAGLGLAGGLAVVSGAAGGNAAAGAAFNTDVNNRQIHHDERERIKRAAGGDKVREEKLTKAACFEVKCWAQYPEGSELYNQHHVSVAEMAFLQDEWAWVKGQQAQGEFLYTPAQWAADGIAANTGMARDSFRGQRIEGMPPSNEGDACVTGECAAGVLPAPSEMRSVEQIQRDLEGRICEWAVSVAHPLPGSRLMKPIYDRYGKVVGWATEHMIAEGVSDVGKTLICR